MGVGHLDDIVSDRVKHQFTDRMKLQFAHQIGAVRLCRLDAQTECDRYFSRALSFWFLSGHDGTLRGGLHGDQTRHSPRSALKRIPVVFRICLLDGTGAVK
jgi:hypothetical protein